MASVSVLVPALNAANTVNATIDSVVKQIRDDWELIVFDDSSTDDTATIVKDRCEVDSRIRLIRGSAGGAAKARNQVAQHAKADWLLFLDADDIIRQDHLALTLTAATTGVPPDLVYASGARLAPDGRIGSPEVPPKSDHFQFLGRYNIFYTHACLIRRSIFESFGGFDPTLATCEDWDLWQRLARAGASMKGVDECLAFYRMRPNSLSHDATRVFANAREVILRGHGPDIRVREPLPEYAEGLEPDHSGDALIGIAMWCAGLLIGGGQDAVPFLQSIQLMPVTEVNVDRAISMMQGGVPSGALALQEDWPVLWNRFRSRIMDAFIALEQCCAAKDFATRSLTELERRIGEIAKMSNSSSEPLLIAPPIVGRVKFGDFFRLQPISKDWGFDRGSPIDRLYIENFLERHRDDIKGRVLEIGDNRYTEQFGGKRVTTSDVLNVDSGAPNATIFGDLATAHHIASNLFDCIILVQTLQYVFDLPAAIGTLYRILKPGGVVLITAPGIAQIDYDRWGEARYWSMTPLGMRRLLAECFSSEMVEVETRGNVLTAISVLHGLAQEDLPSLGAQGDDPHYPVNIQARAVKSRDILVEQAAKRPRNVGPATAHVFIRNLNAPPVASVMVVAAHPDDELIGAGGHLSFWPRLSVVYVTNGAPRNPIYAKQAGYADPKSYASARRREAEDALSLIGIPANRIISLGFDDQEASFKLVEVTHAILRLFEKQRPDIVVTHAYEGGHPDHDATCFAVQSACQMAERMGFAAPSIVEMSSYFGRDGIRVTASFPSSFPPSVLVRLDQLSRDLKLRLLNCHISQAQIIKLFPIGIECFRAAPVYDFFKAPLGGKLFYEYHDLGMDGVRWRQLAAAALVELGLSK